MSRADLTRIGGRRGWGETFDVDNGTAMLVRDPDRRSAWTLFLDDVESSHVDLDDPTYLAFEYVRWLGDVIDLWSPSGTELDVVHLGGGAATLARYVAATRPASRQVVFEIDAALVELVRTKVPLPKNRHLRIRIGDARLGMAGLAAASTELVVRDVFRDGAVPDPFRTVEFCVRVREILRPGGGYLLNVADERPFTLLGVDLAALLEVFEHVALVSEPSVLRGRRRGNVVVIASDAELPIEAISRRVADGGVQGRVRVGGEVRALARGRRPLRDADLPPA